MSAETTGQMGVEILGPLALAGAERRRQIKTFSARGAASTRIYTNADRERWREIAAEPDLARLSKTRKAAIIAKRDGLPEEAEQTIRKAI